MYYGVQLHVIRVYQVRFLQINVLATILANAANHFNLLFGVARFHYEVLYFCWGAINLKHNLHRLGLFLEVHFNKLRFVECFEVGDDLLLIKIIG